MPITAENRKAATITAGDSSVGQPAAAEMILAATMPVSTPAPPPMPDQQHRLDQELQQHMDAPRADRHADADLAGALGDRDQQDVHDADAADQQRDRGDGGQQDLQHAAALLGHFGDLGQVAHGEIIIAIRLDAVAALQRLGHLIHRLIDQLGVAGLDIDAC